MAQPIRAEKNKGFVILYAVVVVGMVVFSLALYFSWMAIFLVQNEVSLKKSKQAQYLADTCSEVALQNIWNNSNATGSGNLSEFNGSCTYQIINTGSETRQINATGTVGNFTRKTKIILDKVTTQVRASSWREVGDF